MKTNLQALIEILQSEHDYLEREMNDCLKEMDFKGAEAFSRPLLLTRAKLKILQNLHNPNTERINKIESNIRFLRALEHQNENKRPGDRYLDEKIEALEAELKKLNRQKPEFRLDGEELLTCIEKLIKGELKSFTLEFEEKDYFLQVEKIQSEIKISLVGINSNNIETLTGTYGLEQLSNMGFTLQDDNCSTRIKQKDAEDSLIVLEFLSRIIYDVCKLYGDKRMTIKYLN